VRRLRAEAAALQAIEAEPLDGRAHHALAHVFEMQGRAAEGIRRLGARSAQWCGVVPGNAPVVAPSRSSTSSLAVPT